jgi:hypothetical protein
MKPWAWVVESKDLFMGIRGPEMQKVPQSAEAAGMIVWQVQLRLLAKQQHQ